MKRILTSLLLTLTLSGAAFGQTASNVKHVLCFTKFADREQKIVHRDGDQLSLVEKALQKLGNENNIDFTFSKDGRIFTPENIAKFDAFFFFTGGDLTHEDRTGRGDNYPQMTLEGKKAFLDAIQNGKGFIGCNEANFTFRTAFSPGENKDPTNAWRYTRMIGAGYMGHNAIQTGYFSYMDHKFPGMENVPDDYSPVDQWYAFNRLMPDIHVVMALDAGKLKGNLYGRPSYPVAWARMEGKGRVFYTTMGHTGPIWKDPVFLQMLLGGIRWADGTVDADITPDISKVTPQYNDIPQRANRYIADEPPIDNPHFPNYQVHVPLTSGSEYHSPKYVLFFSKSAGYEHPVVYRDSSSPCFAEKELLELGRQNNIYFVFSKDTSIFTPENMAKFDAFVFYTCGDLTLKSRQGVGDNYPPVTPEAKEAFLRAIHDGKGFVGLHCAVDTFSHNGSAGSELDPYGKMLGAGYIGYNRMQKGHLIQLDTSFPGMEHVPADFDPVQEWYSMKDFQPDLHVILALDCGKMTGNLYERPNYPVAWARMEGKGRVFYTILGHDEKTWNNPAFQQMLLGGIRWADRSADADITPNLSQATPQANEIPEAARKVVDQ